MVQAFRKTPARNCLDATRRAEVESSLCKARTGSSPQTRRQDLRTCSGGLECPNQNFQQFHLESWWHLCAPPIQRLHSAAGDLAAEASTEAVAAGDFTAVEVAVASTAVPVVVAVSMAALARVADPI